MSSSSGARLKRALSMLTMDPKKGLIKGAVAEAAFHPHGLCNQMCGTHVFIKYFEGGRSMVFNQIGGQQHKCPNYERAKLFGALANTIPIAWIKPTIDELAQKLWSTYRSDHEFIVLIERLNTQIKDKTMANEALIDEWQKSELERGDMT